MKIAFKVRAKHGELVRILERHGITQAEFARRIGLTTQVFWAVINLRKRPSRRTLNMIEQGCLSLGEYCDVNTWWPDAFLGMTRTTQIFFREVDAALLNSVNTPVLPESEKLLLEEALDQGGLDSREREVLDRRLDGESMDCLKAKFQRTTNRMFQIERSAVRKIRQYIREYEGEARSESIKQKGKEQ